MKFCARLALIFLSLTAMAALAIAQERFIKPDDKVRVVCEEEPSLTKDYTVTKDGLLVLSFIGAIEVSGLTEKQAADKIAAKLLEQRIVKKATVTVTLATPETKGIRYSGAVQSSGEVGPRDGMRLSDIVALAKPTEAADLEKVEITTATSEKIVVNFKQFTGQNMELNPVIRAGDAVFFPIRMVSSEVLVLGGVSRPGAVVFKEGMKVREFIDGAGGFVAMADKVHVRIERAGSANQIIDLSQSITEFEVKPGDHIVVDILAVQAHVIVTGEVARPGTVSYIDGLTLMKAIQEAGGLTTSADKLKVTVIPKAAKKGQTYNLDQIQQGYVGDVALSPDDQIFVPKKGARRLNPLAIAGGVALLFFFITR